MISTQFLQNCQSGDEEAIETLVRTHQRGVFQLALSILDDAPVDKGVARSSEDGSREGTNAQTVGDQTARSIAEAAAEAELATRETFTAALDRLNHYREDVPFTTWLYGIALQMTLRRLRRWKFRKWWWRIAGRHLARIWFAVKGGEPEPAPAPEPVNFQPGDLEMWSAIRGLNPGLRIPVVLHYYHEFPLDEIALLMHISEGAVHARLDTAREKIARTLEK